MIAIQAIPALLLAGCRAISPGSAALRTKQGQSLRLDETLNPASR